MTRELVPQSFQVPDSLETEKFRLEILRPDVTEIDYDAVMSSRVRLRGVFAETTEWPRDDMTLQENTDDLRRHEKEFHSRVAFAFTVLSPDRERCLGCVYLDPPKTTSFDIEVYLWVRDDCLFLDEELYITVKEWADKCWPFDRVAFPGREISWQQWASYA